MTWINANDVMAQVTDEQVIAMDRYRPRPMTSTYKIRRSNGQMRERFLQGIPEPLSRKEKTSYRNGEWAK